MLACGGQSVGGALEEDEAGSAGGGKDFTAGACPKNEFFEDPKNPEVLIVGEVRMLGVSVGASRLNKEFSKKHTSGGIILAEDFRDHLAFVNPA